MIVFSSFIVVADFQQVSTKVLQTPAPYVLYAVVYSDPVHEGVPPVERISISPDSTENAEIISPPLLLPYLCSPRHHRHHVLVHLSPLEHALAQALVLAS